MNGSEIISLWKKACKDVEDIHGNPGGEIGGRLRNRGYTITYDGGSVCSFRIKGKLIVFGANCCCGEPWHVEPEIGIGEWKGNRGYDSGICRVSEIVYDREYEVQDDPSYSELFDSGRLVAKSFAVVNHGSEKNCHLGEFDNFLKADELARKECRREIDVCDNSRWWREYSAGRVVNDEQQARECYELRHYEYYRYPRHECWISVDPVGYEIKRGGKDGE